MLRIETDGTAANTKITYNGVMLDCVKKITIVADAHNTVTAMLEIIMPTCEIEVSPENVALILLNMKGDGVKIKE